MIHCLPPELLDLIVLQCAWDDISILHKIFPSTCNHYLIPRYRYKLDQHLEKMFQHIEIGLTKKGSTVFSVIKESNRFDNPRNCVFGYDIHGTILSSPYYWDVDLFQTFGPNGAYGFL